MFKAQATSNRPGRCSLVAATGTKKYPAAAPGPFQFAVVQDPKAKSRVRVVHGLGFNVHATLGNPYFPSECSTSLTGEPDMDEKASKSVPKGTFQQKTVVIRFQGATKRNKIVYRWSTVFTLKRTAYTP